MYLEFHHGGRTGEHLIRQKVFPDNDNLCARRPYILLHARVNQTILCHIHRLRQEAGGHIGNKNFALRVRQGMILGSVDRIVLADIDIIHIICYGKIGTIRNIGECLVCRGRQLHGLPVNLRLRKSLFRPLSRQDIARLAVLHQIHGNRRKQKARAAL